MSRFHRSTSARCQQAICITWILVGMTSVGCIRDTYLYGLKSQQAVAPANLASAQFNDYRSVRVSSGGYHPRVDRVESIVQSPRRLVYAALGKPRLSPQQEQQQRQLAAELAGRYLNENQLNDVFVDVRRYEPAEQWQRLMANDRISPFWKYTGGVIDFVGYSLLPNRALQRNSFSPFTNTLSINSTRPTSALYEASSAKEYRQHEHLGTYTVLQRAPLVPLVHHAKASTDVLTYAHVTGQEELTRDLFPTSYGKLGGAVVSEALFFVPLPSDTPFFTAPAARVAGRVVGGVAGKIALKTQEKKIEQQPVALQQ
jgi:hypothetical protein